ncbi:hypothetical protein CPB86DRAFT_107598 [Serendipita vermifera]|nr:hypothetical protein CPB86DRAFT_107598 [Serendipita vermifera]
MSIRFILHGKSMTKMSLTCESLDTRYTVTEQQGVLSVVRWDRNPDSTVTIGQLRAPIFGRNKIRLGQDGEWRLLKEVLYRGKGDFWLKQVPSYHEWHECLTSICSAKTFEGANGAMYRWKTNWTGHVMYHDDKSKGKEPLVRFIRQRIKNTPYVEVVDPSVLDSLDMIILTCLIMERTTESGGGSGGG